MTTRVRDVPITIQRSMVFAVCSHCKGEEVIGDHEVPATEVAPAGWIRIMEHSDVSHYAFGMATYEGILFFCGWPCVGQYALRQPEAAS